MANRARILVSVMNGNWMKKNALRWRWLWLASLMVIIPGCAGEETSCFGNSDCDTCEACVNGSCVTDAELCGQDPCEGVVCDNPPASKCIDADTLQVFHQGGNCVDGDCAYGSDEVTCANGCEQDACKDEPCAGITCDQPPVNKCQDETTLLEYANTGTCSAGECDYSESETTCDYQCQLGACVADPCADVLCNTPDDDVCEDQNTLLVYQNPGTCSAGKCSYPSQPQTCDHGCAQGACLPAACAGITCDTAPDACHQAPGVCVEGICQFDPVSDCLNNDACCPLGCGPTSDNDCLDCEDEQYPCPTGCCDWKVDLVARSGGYQTSLVLDQNQFPHISHNSSSIGDLKYAHWDGENWQLDLVDTGADAAGETSLALDQSGKPHILYQNLSTHKMIYRSYEGPGWLPQDVDPLSNVEDFSSMVLDQQDIAHIVYRDSKTSTLKYARQNGATFNIEDIDTDNPCGTEPSLQVDALGFAHVSYFYNETRVLKYARQTASGWDIHEVELLGDSYVSGIGYSSLVLDADGNPHIAYFDEYANKLKYAYWSAGNFLTVTVDAVSNAGLFASLALDRKGHPHIAYQNTSGQFKYAFFTGQGWEIMMVDISYGMGEHCSLALDDNDHPHISVRYQSDNSLYYVHW